MDFNINTTVALPDEVRVGNVYPVGGGYGRRAGHLMVLFAIAEPANQYNGPSALLVVIDKHGKPRGVTSYGLSAIEDRSPIAFCEGIDGLSFEIRSL